LRESQKICDAGHVDETTQVDDEKCPVIRAHQVFITGGTSGRARIVFF
jgi:hypothetical protein